MRARLVVPAAFAVYLIAAVILFGLPVLGHMQSSCLCIGSTHDEGIVAWSLAWWPHALLHGLNPFHPKDIYVPQGINIALGTTMPGLAYVMWPVTALTSPLFAFNLAALLAPVLAAFFAFLLCRRLIAEFGVDATERYDDWLRFAAALVGGWLFGFSSYMLGQETGHLNLTLVFLVPALIHLGVRLYAGELRSRCGIALVALALVGQFSLSTEIFATFAVFAVTALVLGWLVGDTGARRRVIAMLKPLAIATVICVVIVSPYLWYALKPGGEPVLPQRTATYSADLLGFVIPTQITRLLGLHFLHTTGHFTAGFAEGGEYLGLPLIALLLWGAWRARRRRAAWLLAGMVVISAVASLGAHLHVDGHRSIPLPWDLIAKLPLYGVALPVRLAMYCSLTTAALAAVTLAGLRGRARIAGGWVLAAAAVVALWPAVNFPFWHGPPNLPALFRTSAYRRVLKPSDTVLITPSGIYGDGMLWQAEAHLSFRMAGGYVLAPEAPDPYKAWGIYPTLNYLAVGANTDAQARSFIAAHHVTVAVMSLRGITLSPWPRILGALGWHAKVVAGALVLRPAGQPIG